MQKRIFLSVLSLFIYLFIQAQNQWDRPMQVKSCTINIKADAFTATTFIEMEFYNPNNTEIEGLYNFTLDSSQLITAFQLDLNGKYRDGSIEEKWKATTAYNTIVGKRVDPALLTRIYDNTYSLRIYPVPARSSRKITMAIQQLLKVKDDFAYYSLPLNIADTVQHFKLDIGVSRVEEPPSTKYGLIFFKTFIFSDQYTISLAQSKAVLKTPVGFSIPLRKMPVTCTKTVDQKKYFALRFQPAVSKDEDIHPKFLTVFWDASSSTSKRDLGKEINFLKSYIDHHSIAQITIIPFNTKLLDTATFYTKHGFNSQWQQYLRAQNNDGGTQLGIIDFGKAKADVCMLFSDGSNTYGNDQSRTDDALVYCINSSAQADLTNLNNISRATGGKVINLYNTQLVLAVEDASVQENWLLSITSPAGKIAPHQSLPIKADKTLFISGNVLAGQDELQFHYGTNKGIKKTEKIKINGIGCDFSAINRMSMFINFPGFVNQYRWEKMLDYGIQEKVVTYHTAYIVLEKVEDYIKYNITPPKELEEECNQMQYVKADSRFQRDLLKKRDEFQLLSDIVNVYNNRILQYDKKETFIYIDKQQYESTKFLSTVMGDRETNLSQQLNGKVAGLNIQSENSLNEVVVVGYATAKRKSFTSPFIMFNDNNSIRTYSSVEQALEARVGGVQVLRNDPGTGSIVRLRGLTTINDNGVLFVLDGVPINGDINNAISVNDIQSVTVLKEASATAIYGSRGSNGVVLIESKRGERWHPNRVYKLKNMEDVEYLQEIKAASLKKKIAIYKEMREQYGEEAGFYFDIAQHFFESGLKNEAFEILMNAAEVSNGSSQVIKAMGYTFESWKQFDKAIEVYQQLINNYPADLQSNRDLALAYYQYGNYQQAVEVLFNALKIDAAYRDDVYYYSNPTGMKSMMLNEMNAIIAMHKDSIDISAIPLSMIKALPVDLRIVLSSNKHEAHSMSVREPGGQVCSPQHVVTKNGGYMLDAYQYYYYDNTAGEYQIRQAKPGKYKVSVKYNMYGYSRYYDKIPTFIRVMSFKNFGKPDQSITIENVIMDNQSGEIEIAEVEWEK